jgi:hypothetical protein
MLGPTIKMKTKRIQLEFMPWWKPQKHPDVLIKHDFQIIIM